MTKLSIDQEIELIKPMISAVLSGHSKVWNTNNHYPAGKLINMVRSISGVEDAHGLDTNGWQWDWWMRFKYEGKTYVLSGSGYYGTHAFQLDE